VAGLTEQERNALATGLAALTRALEKPPRRR
jgi:hypothetical protein